jgi:hypothetical protein
MSNDPLPLPDHADMPPRKDAGDEAVGAARGRGGSFLTEYRSRQSQPDDAQKFASTIARLEAAMRDNPPAQMPAALARALTDSVAAIGQIEAVLAACVSSAPDVHFAVERIQDIAMALRQRDVEDALCDGLEAAIREVGDAIVRNDAASAGALHAAALLHELARRVDKAIARGETVEPGVTESRAGDEAATVSSARRFDDTAHRPVTDTLAAHSSDDDVVVRPPPEFESELPPPLPETQAAVTPQEDPGDLIEPPSLPIPSPIEGGGQESQAQESQATDSKAQAPRADASTIARVAANDPFAALHTLSEEELIALFS